ncbi:4,5-dihydroxyphthalate decarboxylase [Pseudonocardia ammonioxydans]|uniref:4,5-dihydroxyphthalate decarboxylase n=1 Tax=Pseudonocardia ammonioxydans TaxID=260086 RepID=A0A1I5HUM6_PSUAM|nr:4,5-dihydroxyphthalate decarboxylase [Pseudonocardia ammonioxydans]SFO51967.1 4,5-dihydroxyphthalate decarboxylase [Pseudonocardia ammonioxydans]
MSAPISLACWDYDRTRALADGRIRPTGVDLTYLDLPVEETFFRMLRHREFDAAEMSLASYVTHLGRATSPDLVAIPVFPSRAFRHGGIYVRTNSPARQPADLAGGVVGVPEWQLTAVVWIRGILADRHGLPIDAVRYRTGGMHEPGRVEKQAVDLPPGVEASPIPPDRTLVDMLTAGEIDALYAPRTPRPMREGDTTVRRLFTDPRAEEERYAAETGIFPIMHTVVLRQDVYRARPWLARSLLDGFTHAKELAEDRMAEEAANPYLLPWAADELRRTRALLGRDHWAYGVDPNRAVLEVFLRYAHDQGLTPRQLAVDDLFVPETRESVIV